MRIPSTIPRARKSATRCVYYESMIADRDILFIAAFALVLALAILAGVVYYLFFTRPLLRRLHHDRERIAEIAHQLGFSIATRYQRVFAYGTSHGLTVVFWGPYVRMNGFTLGREFILAVQTDQPGKSHVAAMFGKDLAERMFGRYADYKEVTKTVPADSTFADMRAAMFSLVSYQG